MLIIPFSFCLRKGLVKGNSDFPPVNQGFGFHEKKPFRKTRIKVVLCTISDSLNHNKSIGNTKGD